MAKKSQEKWIISKDETKLYFLLPIIIALAVVPLIVYLKIIPLEGVQFEFWKGDKENPDFYSYYKSLWIIISASLGATLMILRKVSNQVRIRKTSYYIPMLVYIVLIILSTLFAEHKDVAIRGFVDRYESMYVLISYVILMFITINFTKTERQIKVLLGTLVGSAVLIGTIGIFQYLGHDFLQSSTGKLLILPEKYHYLAKALNFNFGKHTIYATMYNTNYVGSYMAMLFPISFGLIMYFKNKYTKLISVLFAGLMFANLLGSNSRAGIMGVVFALIMLSIIFRKEIYRQWKIVGASMAFLAIVILGLNSFSGGRVFSRLETLNVINETGQIDDLSRTSEKPFKIKDIVLDGEKASIITNTEKITLLYKDKQLSLLDEDDNRLPVISKGKNIIIEDARYKEYSFNIDESGMIIVHIKGHKIEFAPKRRDLLIVGNQGKVSEIVYPETFGFKGNERFASGRGYIWSRSIPMLKDTVLIGHGPDTYAIYFPQKDYVGKLNGLGAIRKIVDKPHNLYLQIGINTGVLSLLAVLAMFGMYFFSSLKIYLKASMTSFKEIMGASIFSAFVGYCVAGMFNDSVVSVAPVFWVLFGLGISINMMLEKEITEANDVKA